MLQIPDLQFFQHSALSNIAILCAIYNFALCMHACMFTHPTLIPTAALFIIVPQPLWIQLHFFLCASDLCMYCTYSTVKVFHFSNCIYTKHCI